MQVNTSKEKVPSVSTIHQSGLVSPKHAAYAFSVKEGGAFSKARIGLQQEEHNENRASFLVC